MAGDVGQSVDFVESTTEALSIPPIPVEVIPLPPPTAPIHVGVVYLETDYLESDQDVGGDSRGDRFILTFTGGAADTELTELRILTDKDNDGISVGDPIFDTKEGGRGKNGAHDFQIVRIVTADGRTLDAQAEVEDGGQELVLRLKNFRAGDRLEFTLDVDEVLRNSPDLEIFNDRLDVITSGQEFQDSILEATFMAPHFETAEADALFINDFGDPGSRFGLDLPADEGSDVDSRPNRSAAAVATANQVAKPIDISGSVWIDNNLDLIRQATEAPVPNTTLTLFRRGDDGRYASTGLTATTDAQGDYRFGRELGLKPGVYRVVETQPDGLFSVGAVPGTVDGNGTGRVESADVLTGIAILDGDTSGIQFNFAEASPASISGFVYQDLNQDGKRGASEPPIAGVEVMLVPLDTIAAQSTLSVRTAADGSYSFTGLAPGAYEVIEVSQPAGFTDGLDAAGTVDGVTSGTADNPGDAIRGILLSGGDEGVEYNFGELPLGSIAGRVYLSAPGEDCDGSFDDGDIALPGVTVTLSDAGGIVATTSTGNDGRYAFENVPVGNYTITEYTPAGLINGGSDVGRISSIRVGAAGIDPDGNSVITQLILPPGGSATQYDFCEAAPAAISGYVYADDSNDGVRDAGESAISGISLTLIDSAGNVVAQTKTNADGYYEFESVLPGNYEIAETQPEGFFDGIDTPGTIAGVRSGSNPSNDRLAFSIRQGQTGVEYNFGELRPSSISGLVHVDEDGDCILDEGEQTLSGVTIRLQDSTGKEVAVTTTNQEGRYTFDALPPGTYTVVQGVTEGYFDGDASPGSVGGTATSPNRIGSITLTPGTVAVDYDFCERPPAEISGRVFNDLDQDCEFDAGEMGLAGVVVELYDDSQTLIASTTTDASGDYRFTFLPAGTYTIREIQPIGYLHGGQTAGSGGGDDSVDDVISGILIGFGDRLIQYNFCEMEPSSISGIVYVDGNGDCIIDPDEPPLSGVLITLRDDLGNVLGTTRTNDQGRYTFEGLAAGEYSIHEAQPEGLFQGGQTPGTGNGWVIGEDRLGVKMGPGETLTDYNFCEQPPSSISGTVFVDENGDCLIDPGERTLAGVTITLRDVDGNVVATTTTDGSGRYRFEGLERGQYSIHETQPEGLFQGGQTPGTGDGWVIGEDRLGVKLGPGQTLSDYNFCEQPPSSISGIVFVDENGDCLFDPGERPLAGVTVTLRDAGGNVVATTTTSDDGHYRFEGLEKGEYSITETQPGGVFQGGQTAGTGDGWVIGEDALGVRLGAGEILVDYNFCELGPSSLAGMVWSDKNTDQIFDPNETPIPGVLVELIDVSGGVQASVRSGADGRYRFDNLAPGVYSVREHQPEGYFHGGQLIGNSGGTVSDNDLIVGITLGGGMDAEHYDFPEVPPAMISGYVYQDGDVIRSNDVTPERLREFQDGLRTADDLPLPGVTMELRNVLGQPYESSRALPGTYSTDKITVVTDASGYYEFRGLRPGTYHIYQNQPVGLVDGLDTPGSRGGLAVNVADRSDDENEVIIQTLAASPDTDPRDDAILNVELTAGSHSSENNFSEIVVAEPPPPPPFTPPISQLETPPATIDRVLSPIQTFAPVMRLISFAEPNNAVDTRRFVDEWAVTWHLSVINGGYPNGEEVGNFAGSEDDDDADEKADAEADGNPMRGIGYRNSLMQRQLSSRHNSGSWSMFKTSGEPLRQGDLVLLGDEEAAPLAGDFDGDGTDEAVLYVGGDWFIDFNGNGVWDSGDLWVSMGTEIDRPVIGDWDGDGKDDVGIFGPQWAHDAVRIKRDPGLPDPANHRRRTVDVRAEVSAARGAASGDERLLRRGNDGALYADAVDHVFKYGEQTDVPIAGDWNGDGIDQIGLFRGGQWLLDADGDGRWSDADRRMSFGRGGDEPIVGDFNRDGVDEIGVVRGDTWIIDTDGDGRITGNDLQITIPRDGGSDAIPVVGDFDGDGVDDVGYYYRRAG